MGASKKGTFLRGQKKCLFFFCARAPQKSIPQRVYCSWNYIYLGRWTFESRCMLVRFICLLCLLFESTKSHFLVSWFTLFLLSLHFCWLAPKTYGEKTWQKKSVVNSFSFPGQIPHFFNPFQWQKILISTASILNFCSRNPENPSGSIPTSIASGTAAKGEGKAIGVDTWRNHGSLEPMKDPRWNMIYRYMM